MKNIFIVTCLLFSTASFAQKSTDDADIVKSLFGKSKTEIIAQYMALSPEKKPAFEKLYVAYEASCKKLAKQKLQLILDYAESYASLTDEKADILASSSLKNITAYDKLNQKYYKKFKRVIGAKDAAKLMQMETYIQTAVRGEIQDAIPFIDELDNLIKH